MPAITDVFKGYFKFAATDSPQIVSFHDMGVESISEEDIVIVSEDGSIPTDPTVEVSDDQITVTNAVNGTTYYLFRKTELTQKTNFLSEGPFKASMHLRAFNKLTRIAQDLQGQLERSVKLAVPVDGFEPVIKGGLPAIGKKALISVSGDRTHLTANDYDVDTIKSDVKKASDAAAAAGISQELASTAAGTAVTANQNAKDWAIGSGPTPNKRTIDGKLSSEGYSEQSKASAELAANKLAAIEVLTGAKADPDDIHHVRDLDDLTEWINSLVNGDKATWEVSIEDINQVYYRKLSLISGFPSLLKLDNRDGSFGVKAYIYKRYNYNEDIPVGAYLKGGVKNRTDRKAVGGEIKYDNSGKPIIETYSDDSSRNVTEVEASWEASESSSYDDGSGRLRVYGNKNDGYELSFDGSVVGGDAELKYEVKNPDPEETGVITKGPIVTFEVDIDGAMDILNAVKALRGKYEGFLYGDSKNFTETYGNAQSATIDLIASHSVVKGMFPLQTPNEDDEDYRNRVKKLASLYEITAIRGNEDRLTDKITHPSDAQFPKFKISDSSRLGKVIFTLRRLSFSEVFDQSAALKALYQSYVAHARAYSEGLAFPPTVQALAADDGGGFSEHLIPFGNSVSADMRKFLTKENFKGTGDYGYEIKASFAGTALTVGVGDKFQFKLRGSSAPDEDLWLVGAYTPTKAGSISVQVTFDGAKQYRNAVDETIKGAEEKVINAGTTAVNTVINTAIATGGLIDTAKKGAAASATAAAASATAAAGSAEAADGKLVAVFGSESAASTKAGEAAASAKAAKDSEESSNTIQTNVRKIADEAKDAVANANEHITDVVAINGSVLSIKRPDDVSSFLDSHVTQANNNVESIFNIGKDDDDHFFVIDADTDNGNDEFGIQLPLIKDVSWDEAKGVATVFHFKVKKVNTAKDIVFHNEVNSATTRNDLIDYKAITGSNNADKLVFKGQNTYITFTCKYDPTVGAVQSWVTQQSAVSTSVDSLTKTDADTYYAPKSAVEVLETDVWDHTYTSSPSIFLRTHFSGTLPLSGIPQDDRPSWLTDDDYFNESNKDEYTNDFTFISSSNNEIPNIILSTNYGLVKGWSFKRPQGTAGNIGIAKIQMKITRTKKVNLKDEVAQKASIIELNAKADSSALDAKADKANTRKWFIIDAGNAAGFSISDISQTDYPYYITGGYILRSGTQTGGSILA